MSADQPEHDRSSSDSPGDRPAAQHGRRSFLRWAGLAVGSAGVGAAAVTSGAQSSRTSSGSDDEGDFRFEVLDYVDRTYVLAATTAAGEPLRVKDGLELQLQGAESSLEDPDTGKILVKAARGEEVSGRAVLPAGTVAHSRHFEGRGGVASADVEIGYDAGLPDDQTSFAANGGGACQAAASGSSLLRFLSENVDAATRDRVRAIRDAVTGQGELVQASLRVRAMIQGTVIPRSETHREINWQHARYYGEHDVLGQLRFTYRSSKHSALTMKGSGPQFFPAQGENALYCRLELLEAGGVAIQHEPMRFVQDRITWPPYSTPMNIAEPVTFYDENEPDQEVLTIQENELELYDYNGLTIETNGSTVINDRLTAQFTLTNQTAVPFRGRWMMIGDHKDRAFKHADSELLLGPGGTQSATRTVNVSVPVGKSLLTQTVTFGAMSLSDPVALGCTSIRFRNSRKSGLA